VVTDATSLLGTRLVGRDVQALVDLTRIGDHDFAIKPKREVESELRLPDPGRTDNDRDDCQ